MNRRRAPVVRVDRGVGQHRRVVHGIQIRVAEPELDRFDRKLLFAPVVVDERVQCRRAPVDRAGWAAHGEDARPFLGEADPAVVGLPDVRDADPRALLLRQIPVLPVEELRLGDGPGARGDEREHDEGRSDEHLRRRTPSARLELGDQREREDQQDGSPAEVVVSRVDRGRPSRAGDHHEAGDERQAGPHREGSQQREEEDREQHDPVHLSVGRSVERDGHVVEVEEAAPGPAEERAQRIGACVERVGRSEQNRETDPGQTQPPRRQERGRDPERDHQQKRAHPGPRLLESAPAPCEQNPQRDREGGRPSHAPCRPPRARSASLQDRLRAAAPRPGRRFPGAAGARALSWAAALRR